MIKYPCTSVGSALSKAIVQKKRSQIEKLRTDGPTDLAQVLHGNLVRGFYHERDILRLKSTFVENYGLRPFGDHFCVYIFSSKHKGKLGGFKKVMLTLDTVKALHSFRKYQNKS